MGNSNSVHGSNLMKIAASLEAIYIYIVRVENEQAWTEVSQFCQDRYGRTPIRVKIIDMG